MKKSVSVILTLIFSVTSIFAKDDKQNYIEEPKKNEVVLVGRIHFTTDADRNYLYDAFDVTEEERSYPDLYTLPFYHPNAKVGKPNAAYRAIKADDSIDFNATSYGINGGHFFTTYKLGSDRTIYLTSATIFLGGTYKIPVMLPMYVKLKVPENENFMYIGDFYYSAKGVEFQVTGSIKDSYQDAQNALNKVSKKEHKLCRANLEEYNPEKEGALKYLYSPCGSYLKNWLYKYQTNPLYESEKR